MLENMKKINMKYDVHGSKLPVWLYIKVKIIIVAKAYLLSS